MNSLNLEMLYSSSKIFIYRVGLQNKSRKADDELMMTISCQWKGLLLGLGRVKYFDFGPSFGKLSKLNNEFLSWWCIDTPASSCISTENKFDFLDSST